MRTLLKPLTFFVFYIIITLLTNVLGPWDYAGFRAAEVLPFMAVFLACVTIGYRIGIRAKVRVPGKIIKKETVFLYYSIVIVLVIVIKLLLFVTNLQRAPITSFWLALSDVGYTYKTAIEAQRLMANQDVSVIGQVDTLMGLATLSLTVVGLYYFKEFPKLLKYLFLFLICLILISFTLFRGTQIIFGNMFIYWLSVEAVRRLRTGASFFNRKTLLASAAILAILVFIQSARIDAYNYDASSLATHRLLSLNTDHVLFKILGSRIGVVASLLSSYVSMGYYGLSLSFAEPFVWTYGLGGSFALSGYATQYLNIEPQLYFSYPFRVEATTGWPALMYWQTAFPWIASDLTYPGSLLFFGVVAYFYARALREAILNGNLLSLVFVAHLNILWLFLPANNQLMQERESAIAAISLTILWLLFHNRFNGPRILGLEPRNLPVPLRFHGFARDATG